MELSDDAIAALKPSAKTRVYWDDETTGLGVRVSPKGQKTFVRRCRAEGRSRILKLGPCVEISLAAARRMVRGETPQQTPVPPHSNDDGWPKAPLHASRSQPFAVAFGITAAAALTVAVISFVDRHRELQTEHTVAAEQFSSLDAAHARLLKDLSALMLQPGSSEADLGWDVALKLREAAIASSADIEVVLEVARALSGVGHQHLRRAEVQKAVEAFWAAVRLLDVAGPPAGEDRRVDQTRLSALYKAASLHEELGEPRQAETLIRRYIGDARRLASPSPDSPVIDKKLVRGLLKLGDVLRSTHRNAEAVRVYLQAFELARYRFALAAHDPSFFDAALDGVARIYSLPGGDRDPELSPAFLYEVFEFFETAALEVDLDPSLADKMFVVLLRVATSLDSDTLLTAVNELNHLVDKIESKYSFVRAQSARWRRLIESEFQARTNVAARR